MYPAGVAGITTRILPLRSGLRVRLLEAGPANGTAVVLVHGWGACVYTFRDTVPALVAAGLRVIAFDLRGHGLSEKPVGRGRYTMGAICDDLRDFMDAAALERADLLGHSLGGGVALHFALTHPERIRRLVLAAPVGLTRIRLPAIGHLLTPRFTDRFARYLTPRWLTNVLLRSTYGKPSRVTDRDIDEYWAPSQFPDYYRAARALLEEFDWAPIAPARLASIKCRTLVMLSTADRLIRGAEVPAKAIGGGTVLTLEGAGHLGIEECAEEFNRMVLSFLNQV
jgi:pimeloyl-ACP methyl ester carboxylesterase